ncbi:YciI family protein [Corynebacterium doosanense]|uniref:Uncharacterized protein n=1 Tax=Corynebacterium doosanense CAU 212 = DSM 45436 TaxID=558173 RepID=A0A097ICX5_9CORY|nr:YciI family protein [Corynebacterium doosanense]AIT59982.1 hypothetical protein CDOO_00600 [Corynebacterium doosanense CAU 212 = DSM 45436]
MAQFLLAVVYDPDVTVTTDTRAPEEAFAAVDAFNSELMDSKRFVYACGLTAPAEGVTVTPEGQLSDGPVRAGGAQLGGFWVVEVDNRTEAEALAVRAASACGREIELRAMQG